MVFYCLNNYFLACRLRERESMAEKFFTEARVPQQKDCSGLLFPKVVSPNPSHPCELCVLTHSVEAYKSWLELQLHQTGAILFRGFPVSSASDFNEVVEAFGFDQLPYVGGGFENELNDDPAKAVTFGDGQPLPAYVVRNCSKILDEECVAIPWQKGDVLMLDNLAVLHARLPLIAPPRHILASLCK